jgi:putative membrane protein
MTCLDLLVEPVAMKLGFWHWKNDIIPIQNYAMWFLTSILMHSVIYLFKPKINAKISFIIIGISALFFGFLNILL